MFRSITRGDRKWNEVIAATGSSAYGQDIASIELDQARTE
jgi:hypothetical protein